jgi:hypothetical protein
LGVFVESTLKKLKQRSFETDAGPKQDCRDDLCAATEAYLGTPKKIFTLPGRKALCVKTFKRHFPEANIVGVERIRDDFESICDLGINCTLSSVREYVKHQELPTQHFDVAFLDYFSYLSTEIIEDLDMFLKNRNILHKGKPFVLGLTLMKAMRGSKEDTLDFMKDYIYNGNRIEVANTLASVEMALTAYLSCSFPSAKEIILERSREYTTECSMYFFCFQITL